MNYFSSLRLKKVPMLLEKIEDTIRSKMKLALETEYQSKYFSAN